MLDAVGIAAIPHARCQPISQPQLLLHAPEQKHARIRRQLPAVKANAHLLAGNRWKVKRKYGIFAHDGRSEEHTSELQSQSNLVCRLLLEKKKNYLHIHCKDLQMTILSSKLVKIR